MPATPKAVVLGNNGQKISAATPSANASPAGSVAKPSPSSAGMNTPTEVPSTPLTKNQKKKTSKAAKAAASVIAAVPATVPTPAVPAPIPVAAILSTPVTKQQQEASTSTKQQITPTVESLGLSEEKKTSSTKASPIARNILNATSTKKETVKPKSADADRPKPPRRAYVAHTFRWRNGGGVVKVTGSFNNWEESIVLKKVPYFKDQSEIIIDLDRTQKTLFKFIVDGQWMCTDEFPTEYDSIGNLNNVLPALAA
ncbi:hypothetical protein BGZ95_011303 [Linnemannia exigua]|uniref:AMP-activated protein kinase glycogen-binding domain-containing protein n=1 Tax=Linnemannia exigua TaxID=604196 RepID=A0AAD4H5A0_9FUNG|nr:hypothetical protein BGZ95_011303 [Linnemannia exigua]